MPHSTKPTASAINPAMSDPTEEFAATAQQKRLLRLVYVMAIVLVLLFMGLIGGVIWKSMRSKPVALQADLAAGLNLRAQDLKSASLSQGQLLITTPTELIVIDVAKRKILLREPLAP